MKKNNKKKVVIKDYYANQNKNRKREVNKVRIGLCLISVILIVLISRICCN